jgi:hypothetical protein
MLALLILNGAVNFVDGPIAFLPKSRSTTA